jgi:hypothetical protein
MSQVLRDGPATHGGGIDEEAQPTMHFGGGTAIRRGRFRREQFAQEWFGAVGPVGSVIATGGSRRPAIRAVAGGTPEIVAVKFVEAGAAQAEFIGRGGGGEFRAPESGEDFTDQRSTEAGGKLAIMFFIAARMAEPARPDERPAPRPAGLKRASAPLRPASGPQGGSVRLCAHACPGLIAHCSPLLATRQKLFPARRRHECISTWCLTRAEPEF